MNGQTYPTDCTGIGDKQSQTPTVNVAAQVSLDGR
jgi:hypothetical protein